MAFEDGQTLGRHRRLADSDDSDEEQTDKANVLTVAKAAERCPKEYRLVANGGAFTSLHNLSALKQLDYVDLSNNVLTSIEGVEGNHRLKTVILHSNHLTNITPLLRLDSIRVLNISGNRIHTLDWLSHAKFAPHLLTLISTENRIVSLDGVRALKNIRTLVLSHNKLEELTQLASLSSLEKFSASHNSLRVIPPEFSELQNLRELRLPHNRINALPLTHCLGRLTALQILDVGHNRIENFDNLSACLGIISVNLRGNPACSVLDDVQKFVRGLCEQVQIVDGVRVAGGKRKTRINRLRMAAGMPAETDRKFARAPPAEAVKRLLERENTASALDKDARAEGLRVIERAARAGVKRKHDNEAVDQRRDQEALPFKQLSVGENASTISAPHVSDAPSPNRIPGKQAKLIHAVRRQNHKQDMGNISMDKEQEVNVLAKENSTLDNFGDAEIDPDEFVQQARVKASAKTMGGAKVRKILTGKRKQKQKRVVMVRKDESFGIGGDSKW